MDTTLQDPDMGVQTTLQDPYIELDIKPPNDTIGTSFKDDINLLSNDTRGDVKQWTVSSSALLPLITTAEIGQDTTISTHDTIWVKTEEDCGKRQVGIAPKQPLEGSHDNCMKTTVSIPSGLDKEVFVTSGSEKVCVANCQSDSSSRKKNTNVFIKILQSTLGYNIERASDNNVTMFNFNGNQKTQTVDTNASRQPSKDKTQTPAVTTTQHITRVSCTEESSRNNSHTPQTLKTYQCSLCRKMFTELRHLVKHQHKHSDGKPHKSDICGKEFSKLDSLTIQRQNGTDGTQYKGICSDRYSTLSSLSEHQDKHTGRNLYKHQPTSNCKVCGKRFLKPSNLAVHQQAGCLPPQVKDKLNKCTVCGREFKVAQNLFYHNFTHAALRPYTCDVCGKGYIRRDEFANHQRSHTGEKPFVCDVCGKGYARKNILHIHKKSHTGKRPYKCSVCGKGFAVSGHLWRHQQIHTGDKPHTCNVCGKGFRRRTFLNIHQRTHTGEKPYKCDVCGKEFTQSSNLSTHKYTHTEEKPYKCAGCGLGFARKNQLKAHQCEHT